VKNVEDQLLDFSHRYCQINKRGSTGFESLRCWHVVPPSTAYPGKDSRNIRRLTAMAFFGGPAQVF